MLSVPKEYYIVLSISLLIVVSVLSLIIHFVDKYLKRKKTDVIFKSRGLRNRKNQLLAMYNYFAEFPLTRGYMLRVKRKYEILYPSQNRETCIRSMIFALVVWSISGLLLIILFVGKPSYYIAGTIIFLIWVVNAEVTHYTVRRIIRKVLKELDLFLSDVRHYYYIYGSVEVAVLKAIDHAGKYMKVHGEKIYAVITSDNREEEVIKYNDSINNNFLKMFLAQCIAVVDYGDKTVDDESLFLTNILDLKTNINVEIRKMQKISYMFMGVNAIIIAPLLTLDVYRQWAVKTISVLSDFYYGRNGIIIMAAIFAESVLLYIMVGYLKENHNIIKKNYDFLEKIAKIKPFKLALDNYIEKHYGKIEVLRIDLKRMGESITPKQLIIKKILYAIAAIVFGTSLLLGTHYMSRNSAINNVENAGEITSASDEQQNELVRETIVTYCNLHTKHLLSQEQIENDIGSMGIFKSKSVAAGVAQEIYKRLNKYQSEYLRAYEVLGVLIVGCLAFFLPDWIIKYRKLVLNMYMNDEVIQFHSIILMLMHIDRMTIPRILEFMETFAVIFKDSIRTCLNEYSSGDIEALEKLKDNERFIPFQRLVDDFLMSDKIGFEKAFDEIRVERVNNIEQRKQDNDLLITNKGILAQYLTYFHCATVIMIYMAIPFITASMDLLDTYNKGIT